MRIRSGLASVMAASLALGGLAGLALEASAQERSERQRNRPLRTAGEPGRVAAADWSLARLSREEGQWTAFREMVGPGALFHQASGPVDAAQWLAGRADPPEAEQWAPSVAWTSCDGTLAVTEGRFRQADGMVGTYVTVWALQRDRSYKWTYNISSLDNPQPAARARPAQPAVSPADLIEVVDIPSVRGHVADCLRRGESAPSPVYPSAPDHPSSHAASSDGTLHWAWGQHEDGFRYVTVDYLRDGGWQEAVNFSVPPANLPQ